MNATLDSKKINFINLAKSIELSCNLLYKDMTTFRMREEDSKIEFVVDYDTSTVSWADFKLSIRDSFKQGSHGYPSIKVIYDYRSNLLITRTKYKGVVKTTTVMIGNFSRQETELVFPKEEIQKVYKRNNLGEKTSYIRQRFSNIQNTQFYFNHYFKYSKKNIERVLKLFDIFIEQVTQ